MTSRTKRIALSTLAAVLLFLAGALWGVRFAFPEPDASPEKAAQMQRHARVSGWAMFGSGLLLLGSGATLVWTWWRDRRRRSAWR